MVHPGAELANIGETNSEFPERGKFMGLVSARRDADLVERAPKAIAGMRVVMANVCRPLSGREAFPKCPPCSSKPGNAQHE
jgi:hypothetical protein